MDKKILYFISQILRVIITKKNEPHLSLRGAQQRSNLLQRSTESISNKPSLSFYNIDSLH